MTLESVDRLSDGKRARIVELFGDKGRDWIDQQPDLVARCVERWGLKLTSQVEHGLPINQVFFCSNSAQEELVLKIGVPHNEQRTEREALHHFAGRCSVRLIGADPESGAMLLERAIPGTLLKDLQDDLQRTAIFAALMRDLALPEPDGHQLPRYVDWLYKAFSDLRARATEELPAATIELAIAYFTELDQGSPQYLLHGDLHPENILLDRNGHWLAIDPKGVIGPLLMETGRFMQNQLPGADELSQPSKLENILHSRGRIIADVFDVEPVQILKAAYVDAVLSCCWSLSDGEKLLPERWSQLEVLEAMTRAG